MIKRGQEQELRKEQYAILWKVQEVARREYIPSHPACIKYTLYPSHRKFKNACHYQFIPLKIAVTLQRCPINYSSYSLPYSHYTSNLGIGAVEPHLGNQFDSQETVTWFDFSQTARRLLSSLNSNIQISDGSQKVAVRLTLENTLTPTTLRQLTLSIDDLESQEEVAMNSDLELQDMEQGPGGCNDACSQEIEKLQHSCNKYLDLAVALTCWKGTWLSLV